MAAVHDGVDALRPPRAARSPPPLADLALAAHVEWPMIERRAYTALRPAVLSVPGSATLCRVCVTSSATVCQGGRGALVQRLYNRGVTLGSVLLSILLRRFESEHRVRVSTVVDRASALPCTCSCTPGSCGVAE